MAKTKIILADDHPLFLSGLVALLSRENDFEVCAFFANGEETLKFLSTGTADVCILDVNMPIMDGIETVKSIRAKNMCTKVIMLTTYNDIEFIRTLREFNISGYVLKNSTGEELVQAIRKVIAGETWYSPEIKEAIANDFLNASAKKDSAPILTPREIEIVKLLAKENTNDQIAEKLFISFRTVETHRKNIMQKTGAKNLAGLINFAHSNGLLT